jgi:hypothetical protein
MRSATFRGKFLVFLAVSALFIASQAAAGGSQEIAPQKTADGSMQISADGITVNWLVSGDSIAFEVTAPTTGWVSIGFNPSRVMKDADFIIGYVENGKAVVRDQFGNGTFSHKSDTDMGGSDDILEFGGSESGGKTTLSFTIPIDSGDEYDTVLTPGQEHTVLIAYGPDGADNFTKKHSVRAKVKVTL